MASSSPCGSSGTSGIIALDRHCASRVAQPLRITRKYVRADLPVRVGLLSWGSFGQLGDQSLLCGELDIELVEVALTDQSGPACGVRHLVAQQTKDFVPRFQKRVEVLTEYARHDAPTAL